MKLSEFASVLMLTLVGLAGVVLSSCIDCEDFVAFAVEAVPVDENGDTLSGQFDFEYREESNGEWTDCEFYCEKCNSPHALCVKEERGTFEVRGTNGEVSGMVSNIRVTADRCHVKTRRVEVVMQ